MLDHACRKWASLVGGAVTISLLIVAALPAQEPVQNPVPPTPAPQPADMKKQAEVRRQEAEARRKVDEEIQKRRLRDIEAMLRGNTSWTPGDLQHFTPLHDSPMPNRAWIEVDSMWWRSSR